MKNSSLKLLLFAIVISIIFSFTACESKSRELKELPVDEFELTVDNFVFDGPLGSQGTTIKKIDKNLFKVTLGHAPNRPTWNNKLNFHITDNAKGKHLVLIVEGPKDFALNEYFSSWSYDMENWNPVHWNAGYKISPARDTLVFPLFEQNQVWVGHQVPISYDQVEDYILKIKSNNNVSVDTLGKSLGERNLYRVSVTDNESIIPAKDKWVHYFSNSHPGEHNAQWRMIGKMDWLLSEKGRSLRDRSICHFVFMMSPDAPHNGWYRVNAEGVDMNRSYRPEGSDIFKQTHEAYIFQRDLEGIMASESPVTTIWGHHTWQGIVEPMVYFVQEEGLAPFAEWRRILQELDKDKLIKTLSNKPLTVPSYGAVSWDFGPYQQFNITAILCEGGGSIYTKEENIKSGEILIESIDRYYKGNKQN